MLSKCWSKFLRCLSVQTYALLIVIKLVPDEELGWRNINH